LGNSSRKFLRDSLFAKGSSGGGGNTMMGYRGYRLIVFPTLAFGGKRRLNGVKICDRCGG
jgi:hypothetical protein